MDIGTKVMMNSYREKREKYAEDKSKQSLKEMRKSGLILISCLKGELYRKTITQEQYDKFIKDLKLDSIKPAEINRE